LQITEPPLPCIALPTTAGTGSEATKNAVISSYDPPFKKSLRADGMLPRIVLVDPKLSLTVPPAITAQTGMDAITQLIESYISRKARPIPQALAANGLRLALPAIVEAVENGSSRPAREAMAQAALLSGMALANSGLGLAHGVAAALGVHFRIAHGAACAMMLGVALRVNRPVCERQLAELARAAGLRSSQSNGEAADALLDRIAEISERIGVPTRLSALGVTREALPGLVRDARGNSMDGNPRTLSDEELHRILEAWQQIMRFASFRPGEVNRALDVAWCASGKVANVGMALKQLGATAETIALVGGRAGESIRAEFAADGIEAHWIEAQQPTRVCTTILDLQAGRATELVENAQAASQEELSGFRQTYSQRVVKAQCVVLTGSLPAGAPSTFYRDLLADTPCPAIVDFRGPELLLALKHGIWLAKPNREELALTLGREVNDDQELRRAMQELNDRGALWVVVSQGADTLWASSQGRFYRLTPPRVTAVNPIGSGDCLAAGLAYAMQLRKSPEDMLRFAVAAAVENVGKLLPARLDLAQVQERARQVGFAEAV
jgi:1-phosphofructokinase family hexose kinase